MSSDLGAGRGTLRAVYSTQEDGVSSDLGAGRGTLRAVYSTQEQVEEGRQQSQYVIRLHFTLYLSVLTADSISTL